MIFLNPGLLAGLHRVTKKQPCLNISVCISFNGFDIGKFPTVIRQNEGKQLCKRDMIRGEGFSHTAERLRYRKRSFGVQQNAHHEIANPEKQSQEDFTAGSAYNSVHFHPVRNTICFDKLKEIAICAPFFRYGCYIRNPLLFASFELQFSGKIKDSKGTTDLIEESYFAA